MQCLSPRLLKVPFVCQILRCGGALAPTSDKGAYVISDTWLSEGHAGTGASRGALRRSSHWVAESAKFRTSEWSAVSLKPRGLLFAPFPRSEIAHRKGESQGSGKVICVSGYTGVWRTSLKELIKRTSAQQVNSLTKKCTHLISFAGNTQKHIKAVEWGVKVVNHLWLHDSITMWSWQPEEAYSMCGKEAIDTGWLTLLQDEDAIQNGVVVDETLLPLPKEEKAPGAGCGGTGAGKLLPLAPWDLPCLSGSASPASSPRLSAEDATAARVRKWMEASTANEASAHALAGQEALTETDERVSGRCQDLAAKVVASREQAVAKNRTGGTVAVARPAVGRSDGGAGGARGIEGADQGRRKRVEDHGRGDAGGARTTGEQEVKDAVDTGGERTEEVAGARRYSKLAAAHGGGGGGASTNASPLASGGADAGGGSVGLAGEPAREDAGARRQTSRTTESKVPRDKPKGSARKAARDSAAVEAATETAAAAADEDSGVCGSKRRTRASAAEQQKSKKAKSCRGMVARGRGAAEGFGGRGAVPERISAGVPQAVMHQKAKVIMVCGNEAERKRLASAIVKLGGATSVSSHSFDVDATHVLTTSLQRTEKLMCACAKGLWVLRPEFVYDSLRKGVWLPEVSLPLPPSFPPSPPPPLTPCSRLLCRCLSTYTRMRAQMALCVCVCVCVCVIYICR